MTTATSQIDGRTARRLANRDKILDAALALLDEGGEVHVETIAERAGVSQRSVYNHFPTARDLVAGMYERGAERLAPLFDEMPSPEDPFDERVGRWAEVTARVLDAIAAMRWRALQTEELYPDLQPELGSIRKMHADSVRTMFPELDRPARQAVVALTDSLGWRALRRHQGLGISQATNVIEQTVRRLAG